MRQINALTLAIVLVTLPLFGAKSSVHASDHGAVLAVLTVSGLISPRAEADRDAEEVDFSIEDLEKLPQTELRTHTDWTEGLQIFSGVLLKDLIEAVGASGKEIVARALNDYAANIPVSDAYELSVLIAIKHNGQYMRIRDKGPLWIIYPSAQTSSSKVNPYNDRMVWQLSRLEFR
ncbi:molybdopterin-dependent oxidoreductase [Allomesorhizobium camelthorni]|uniref:Molybdopterin-dependent oxidoreductase n=1 Tax=Allomesorhizobium camelthorni TaxID=475069 RepID=A0A6G4WAG6_9HYPH|nr:molybdopterin-dependent oxidoreductase [Mesorhizobium camelthorni]NGO51117.1 molybdopterin-dependent oxidoreductase [Mesorhizobium camelthorni]